MDQEASEEAAKAAAEAKAAEAERVRTQVIEPRGIAPSNKLSDTMSGASGEDAASPSGSTTKLKRRRTVPTKRSQQETGQGLTVERSSSRKSKGRKSTESRSKEEVSPPQDSLSRTVTAEEEGGAAEEPAKAPEVPDVEPPTSVRRPEEADPAEPIQGGGVAEAPESAMATEQPGKEP